MQAPDPASYFLVVEKPGLEIDGEFTNITWTEIANRSGAIGGYYDWNVNLGLFASAWRLSASEPQDMTVETHCVRQQNTILIQTVVFSLICQ